MAYANVLAGETQRFIHLLPERRRGELTKVTSHRGPAGPEHRRPEDTFPKALFFLLFHGKWTSSCSCFALVFIILNTSHS